MALVGVELEMLVSEPDARTIRPPPCTSSVYFFFFFIEASKLKHNRQKEKTKI